MNQITRKQVDALDEEKIKIKSDIKNKVDLLISEIDYMVDKSIIINNNNSSAYKQIITKLFKQLDLSPYDETKFKLALSFHFINEQLRIEIVILYDKKKFELSVQNSAETISVPKQMIIDVLMLITKELYYYLIVNIELQKTEAYKAIYN